MPLHWLAVLFILALFALATRRYPHGMVQRALELLRWADTWRGYPRRATATPL
jgi:hypothetical protein